MSERCIPPAACKTSDARHTAQYLSTSQRIIKQKIHDIDIRVNVAYLQHAGDARPTAQDPSTPQGTIQLTVTTIYCADAY